jgi:hypothetical protein
MNIHEIYNWLTTMAVILYYGFLFAYAGVLTGRMRKYSYSGYLPFWKEIFVYFAMWASAPLLLIFALPLRLLGIRMYPIFIPLHFD